MWDKTRNPVLANSILEKNHFPFFTDTLIKSFGSSPSRSFFFSVNTNPLSWYTTTSGSSCVSDNERFSWKMSLTFSLYVSRATSSRRLQFACDESQLISVCLDSTTKDTYSNRIYAGINSTNASLSSDLSAVALFRRIADGLLREPHFHSNSHLRDSQSSRDADLRSS